MKILLIFIFVLIARKEGQCCAVESRDKKLSSSLFKHSLTVDNFLITRLRDCQVCLRLPHAITPPSWLERLRANFGAVNDIKECTVSKTLKIFDAEESTAHPPLVRWTVLLVESHVSSKLSCRMHKFSFFCISLPNWPRVECFWKSERC